MLCGSLSSRPGVSIDLEAEAQPCSLSALLLCVWFRFLDPCTHGGDTSLAVLTEGPPDWVCPIEQSLRSPVPSPQPSQRLFLWGIVALVSVSHLSLRVKKTKNPTFSHPTPTNLQIILQQAFNKYL